MPRDLGSDKGDPGTLLRYTLSTWNPYQTMLMRHRTTVMELDALVVRR